MKRAIALVLAVWMTTSAFAAEVTPAQGDSTPAKKTAKAKPKKTEVSEELQEMKALLQQQQQQINDLKSQLQQRDQAVSQAQQSATQAQSAASDAASKAQAAQAAATDSANALLAVKSDVSDLKTNATTTALSIQEDQKKWNEAIESPLALHVKGITITPGGFLAAETVTRTRAMASDINTPFNSIPFSSADAARTPEFFGSGRQSRISVLAEGKLSTFKLSGYYEMDFLGSGTTSNNNQSNSYVNRQRQVWGQVATTSGWTLTGGQMWSLVAETRKGLDPRSEALPLQIDAQYIVGMSWARQFGMRLSKKINDKVWLGMSVENPQTTFVNASNSPNNFVIGNLGAGSGLYNGGAAASGQTITTIPSCAALPCPPSAITVNTTLGPLATYSFNSSPDLVFKAAFEPGWGHYEVFGVVSRFRDRVYPNATATPASAAGAYNDSKYGGGIGVNARGTFNKKYEVAMHAFGGDGVGRYGNSGLPDVTVHPNGTLAPLHAYQGLAEFDYHAKKWDWYFDAGSEYVARVQYVNAAGKLVGYGVTSNNNTGCSTEPIPGSGGFLPASPSNCSGQTRVLVEGTFGFWFKPYNGPKGRIQFGPQYAYIERNTWRGLGGDPNTNNNVFLTSFRYYLP